MSLVDKDTLGIAKEIYNQELPWQKLVNVVRGEGGGVKPLQSSPSLNKSRLQ